MTTRAWLTGGIMLALLALTGIAYGDAPPKQGTEPDVVAHLAECTEEICLPDHDPMRRVLAAVARVGPARIPTIHPAVGTVPAANAESARDPASGLPTGSRRPAMTVAQGFPTQGPQVLVGSVRPGANVEPCPCRDPVCRPACQQT
jgi:hypothetical protein